MTIVHALLLGIIEGITEFLPVSSTGHLILAARFLDVPSTEFLKSFEIAIQAGAILAVVWLYRRTLFRDWAGLKRVFAAFLPTAVVGFLLYKVIRRTLLGNETIVLASLLLGGIALIVFELFHREKADATDPIAQIPYWKAVLIGLCQSAAVVPGISRAAATIVGGLALGLKRKSIVEFSFLLAIPTMLAATGLDLLKSSASFSGDQFILLAVGFATAFIVAGLSMRFLLYYIGRYNFIAFGVYRIFVALLFWFVIR